MVIDMPAYCCVPGCYATYKTNHLFKFPRDEATKNKWMRNIPRKTFPSYRSCLICDQHFEPSAIIKSDDLIVDGKAIPVPRDRVALKKDAVPRIFRGLPAYLSKPAPKTRTDPETRRQATTARAEAAQEQWQKQDLIVALSNIEENLDKFNRKTFCSKFVNSKLFFFSLSVVGNSIRVDKSFTLDNDFKVQMFVSDTRYSDKNIEFILGPDGKCDRYSKLENLITYLDTLDLNSIPIEIQIEKILNNMARLVKRDAFPLEKKKSFKFLTAQIHLLFSTQLRYSTDLLLDFILLYQSYPAAYRQLRDTKILTIPHPNYCKLFSDSNLESGAAVQHLHQNFKLLGMHEKYVSLIIDEIHIKPEIFDKGNKIEGVSQNANDNNLTQATTVQAFRIASLLSSNKDVVGIYPVKTHSHDYLYQTSMKILKTLHKIGYEVVAIISDNNEASRSLFKEFSPTKQLQPFIASPFNEQKRLFLLFDTVHLLKCIRNDWLDEKSQQFVFPSIDNENAVKFSKLADLKYVYEKEKIQTTKLAPALTHQSLHPSKLERQNVLLALKLFDEKNIDALRVLSDCKDVSGITEFLRNIRNWWSTISVTHLSQGQHVGISYADPIRDLQQDNFKALESFVQWLTTWENHKSLEGKLSKETHSALVHTTAGLIFLTKYLLEEVRFPYVLLGKYQTDLLGQGVRSRNGNVLYQQILESEQKLRIIHVAKLISFHRGDINLTDFSIDKHLKSRFDSSFIPEIEDILSAAQEVELDEQTLSTIIFVAGYVGKKVKETVKCAKCVKLLLNEKKISVTLTINTKHLDNLNRGGLNYPSELSFLIGLQGFQVFQIVLSEKYEMNFLRQRNHKKYLLTLIMESMHGSTENVEYCQCGETVASLTKKSALIWCHFLLNNYCQNADNTVITKKRKLSSLDN